MVFYLKFQKAIANPGSACKYATSVLKGLWYKIKYENILRRATFGKRLRVQGKLKIKGPGQVIFGDDVACAGLVTPYTHHSAATIEIGNRVFLNGTRFGAAKSITVGSNCILADCRIMDTDFHSLRKERHSKEAPVEVRPVHIHSNVWIGAGAAVLKGVTVGENSVVGFGAVVTSDIEADKLAVGNPAKVIRTILD